MHQEMNVFTQIMDVVQNLVALIGDIIESKGQPKHHRALFCKSKVAVIVSRGYQRPPRKINAHQQAQPLPISTGGNPQHQDRPLSRQQ